MAAGHIFFRMDHIQFVGGFVAFAWNGQETNAVNGTDGGTVFGEAQTNFEAGEIGKIKNEEKSEDKKREEAPGDRRCGWHWWGRVHNEGGAIVPESGVQLKRLGERQGAEKSKVTKGFQRARVAWGLSSRPSQSLFLFAPSPMRSLTDSQCL